MFNAKNVIIATMDFARFNPTRSDPYAVIEYVPPHETLITRMSKIHEQEFKRLFERNNSLIIFPKSYMLGFRYNLSSIVDQNKDKFMQFLYFPGVPKTGMSRRNQGTEDYLQLVGLGEEFKKEENPSRNPYNQKTVFPADLSSLLLPVKAGYGVAVMTPGDPLLLE